MKVTTIYALHCPDTGKVKYVGKSNTPSFRLKRHLKEAQESAATTYKLNWLRDLLRQGKVPCLSILEIVAIENWREREIFWVKYYRDRYKITNSTAGGDGLLEASPEAREKLSKALKGRIHSPEALVKMSEVKKGENNPFYGKRHSKETLKKMSVKQTKENNPQFGKKRSLEARAKASLSMKGRKLSDAHKKKLSETKRGERNPRYGNHTPLSKETRKKISDSKTGVKRKPFTEQALINMSLAQQGEKNANYGKPRSLETKLKISEKLTGQKLSQEHRNSISAGLNRRQNVKQILAVQWGPL